MYSEFQDKIVLVTGGTTGIGNATALAFARSGAKVVITGRSPEKGAQAVEKAHAEGLVLDFICANVAVPEEVQAMIQQVVSKYGRLDIAFNNAGASGTPHRLVECTLENWHNVINTNLNGVFYCLKYEVEEMLKTGGGAIVNNCSVSAHRGYPNAPAYIASKHAVLGLTKSTAMAYAAKNIRVNAVSPGLIRTPMTDESRSRRPDYDTWVNSIEPLGRIGEPEEVAESVLWLCSSKASFVTGHILAVDGGILAC